MLTLFSYPRLFGLADNNPFGLKIYAFLKLAKLPFRHEHIFDASAAPRGQLPYIDDDGTPIGDSDAIIAHLTARRGLTLDAGLAPAQQDMRHLISRLLDDLYWVMSYSRWKDPRFWPLFADALKREHPQLTDAALEAARAYNERRYHYQGIGRFDPDTAYARGVADLGVVARLLGAQPWVFGAGPTSADAAVYGFVANVLFYAIDTPLKAFVVAQADLVRHCRAMHEAVSG